MRKIVSIIMILALIGSGFILFNLGNSIVLGNDIPTRSGQYYEMDMNVSEACMASFVGEVSEDFAGYPVSIAGDVNGDGIDDILIGAKLNDEGGTRAGQAYLILGQSTGLGIDMNLSSADASFIGENVDDRAGCSVSGVGDVNGDGCDDILIGAYYNSEVGFQSGQTYLILGRPTGWSMDTNLSNSDASFIGEAIQDRTGFHVSGAGDVNGDGYDDFLIGEGNNGGQSYLILGQSTGWTMDTSLSNADASFSARGFICVGGAGDVNGDGFDDILIGNMNNHEGGTVAGQTYLILGKQTGWSMYMNLDNGDASFIGETPYDQSGVSVAGAGDVNGDGYDDILIGANGNDEGGRNAGKTYLVLGNASGLSMDTDLSTSDASFIGEAVEDNSSFSVSGAGDVNFDGFDDILIGAYGNDEERLAAGQTYLILGRSTGWGRDMDLSSADASFIGEANSDGLGASVSGGGDVNGDGCDDILIGSAGNDDGWRDAGQTYLISGYGNAEPHEIYDIIVTNNIEEEIHIADKLDIVNIEIRGLDSNASTIDIARVNLTFNLSKPEKITLFLIETGINTGVYKKPFIIPARLEYLENIRFSAFIDQTKFKDIQVNTPIRLDPIYTHFNWTEDEFMEYNFENLGYHIVDGWKFNSDASWLNWDDAERKINGTPDNSMVGEYWVNISAEDDQFNKDHMNFTVKVLNRRPSILTDNLKQINQDENYYVDYESDDEGCGDTKWFIEPSLTWLKLDSKSGILSGMPKNNHVGSYNINIWIDDGNGGSNSTEFVLNVVDINDPPVILTEDVTTIDQHQIYYVRYFAEDIDGTYDFDWHLKTDAIWLSIDSVTGFVTGTPGSNDVGVFFVNISVEDDRGGIAFSNFTLIVIDINDEPEWSNVPSDTQIDQGDIYSFDADAIEYDLDDTLTYSISTNPVSDMVIDPSSGEIFWASSLEGLNPTPNHVLNVEISATDGIETITHGFTITVIPNPSPTSTILSPEDGKRITLEGILLEWEGADDGEEPLKYDIYLETSRTDVSMLARSALWMEDVEGTLIETGLVEQGKTYYWTVIPMDIYSSGICTNDVFSFSVNIPPSIQEFAIPAAKIGEEFRLNLMGSDLNGDDLEFNLESGPAGMEIFDGMLTWIPSQSQVGTHTVNVSLNDGFETIYNEFEVEVVEEEIVVEPDEKGSPIVLIIFIIIILLILIGAGIGAFLYLKKKGQTESEKVKEETTPEKNDLTVEKNQDY